MSYSVCSVLETVNPYVAWKFYDVKTLNPPSDLPLIQWIYHDRRPQLLLLRLLLLLLLLPRKNVSRRVLVVSLL